MGAEQHESTHSHEGADGLPLEVRLHWLVLDDGLVCNGMTVLGTTGLDAKALKALPLGRWLEEGRWAVSQGLLESANDRTWAAWNREFNEHRRRRQYGEEHFQLVAAMYSTLAKSSKKPTTRLAEHFAVDVTTARRWVAQARKRGMLPPK